MSDCEKVEVTASIIMTFEGCREHGHIEPTSGYLEAPGVPIPSVIDSALMVIVETIAGELVKTPHVQNLIGFKHDWSWAEGEEELPDRAKRRIVRLVAQQMLLEKVANAEYIRDVSMASLTLPMNTD